jgi:hypothetical protein
MHQYFLDVIFSKDAVVMKPQAAHPANHGLLTGRSKKFFCPPKHLRLVLWYTQPPV